MAELTHDPCCSSHGASLDCATYRRTHFVEVGPDDTMLAICWPSPPHPSAWMVSDARGSLGYEKPGRIGHWPVVGAIPCSPAAGMPLKTDERTA